MVTCGKPQVSSGKRESGRKEDGPQSTALCAESSAGAEGLEAMLKIRCSSICRFLKRMVNGSGNVAKIERIMFSKSSLWGSRFM
jgi:hypothetical protein